jgi:phosphoribosylanthranilate isomerase
MKVKICGITRMQDALAAAEAGAAAVGFIFTPSSRRRVNIRDAARIIRALPATVTPVGVVADMPRALLLELVRKSGVRALQFHGDEPPGALEGFSIPVYKAFGVGEGFNPSIVPGYPGDVILLDTLVDGMRGGTGQSFDWSVALGLIGERRIIMAGGITAAKIGRLVEQVNPYGIDICSGVEASHGIKDRGKIHELFAAVKAAGVEETGCLF